MSSRRRSTFARIVGGAMRACWRKIGPVGENYRKRSLKTRASLMAAIMGEGLITAIISAVFRFVYFAARAFPIMRPKVTERPQQLPVDIFGYVWA